MLQEKKLRWRKRRWPYFELVVDEVVEFGGELGRDRELEAERRCVVREVGQHGEKVGDLTHENRKGARKLARSCRHADALVLQIPTHDTPGSMEY